jgi:hypothetical protein
MENRTTSNPLSVTPPENVADTLVLQNTSYQATGDRSNYRNGLTPIADANSDLRYGPHTASDGVKSFFNFEEDLSDANAQLFVRELKV